MTGYTGNRIFAPAGHSEIEGQNSGPIGYNCLGVEKGWLKPSSGGCGFDLGTKEL